jgi:hypothetical protein
MHAYCVYSVIRPNAICWHLLPHPKCHLLDLLAFVATTNYQQNNFLKKVVPSLPSRRDRCGLILFKYFVCCSMRVVSHNIGEGSCVVTTLLRSDSSRNELNNVVCDAFLKIHYIFLTSTIELNMQHTILKYL